MSNPSRGNWRNIVGGGWNCMRCGTTIKADEPFSCGCDHNPCESPSVLKLRAELIQAQKKAADVERLSEKRRQLAIELAAALGLEHGDGTFRPAYDNRLNELLQEGA